MRNDPGRCRRGTACLSVAAILALGACRHPAPPKAAAIAVSDAEALHHVGELAIVRGRVAAISTSAKGNTFLDFGQPYPKETFTAVIFPDHARDFPNVDRFQGWVLGIRGTIRIFRGRPEIILQSPDQITK